jgi:hypothetical protein
LWCRRTASLVSHHLIGADPGEIGGLSCVDPLLPTLAGRAMLVRWARRIDVECVNLAAPGWAD